MSKVNLYYQKKFSLKNRTLLKSNISKIFRAEKKRFSHLSIIFCSDSYLLGLNQDFLKHDYFTDIITFPLNLPGDPIEGELYISIDRVRENAVRNNVPFSSEIRRVVYHGVLHLCGYGDSSKKDIQIMRYKEDYYLRM